MKIIGIDIAIENLAFCLIDYTDMTISLKAEDWFILDTTPEDYKQTCEYENRKKCSKDAGWYYIDKETSLNRYYCATHKKLVIGGDEVKAKGWKTLNKNYINNNDVIRCMFKQLDQKIELWRSADYIIIEKQPPKNPKMISIMNYIYSYFVIRLWNDTNDKRLKDIIILDAKNKVTYCLDVLPKEVVEEFNKKHSIKKNKYVYYKKISVECVRKELTNSGESELLKYFNSYKKIDDLADSRNMVLWWIKNEQKAITNKTNKEAKQLAKEQKAITNKATKEAKQLAKEQKAITNKANTNKATKEAKQLAKVNKVKTKVLY